MIDIKPVVLRKSQQKELLKDFESADIIVCTSWYAAEYFLKELRSQLSILNITFERQDLCCYWKANTEGFTRI